MMDRFVFISKTAARKQDGKETLQNRGSQKSAFKKTAAGTRFRELLNGKDAVACLTSGGH
jgi:hypothetical protein